MHRQETVRVNLALEWLNYGGAKGDEEEHEERAQRFLTPPDFRQFNILPLIRRRRSSSSSTVSNSCRTVVRIAKARVSTFGFAVGVGIALTQKFVAAGPASNKRCSSQLLRLQIRTTAR